MKKQKKINKINKIKEYIWGTTLLFLGFDLPILIWFIR